MLGNRKMRQREVDVVVALAREALDVGGVVSFEDLRDIEDDEGKVVWTDPRRRSSERTYHDIGGRDLRGVVAVTVCPDDAPGVMLSQPGDVHRGALIQAAIDDKADKLDAYRLKCPEVWLLVVGSSGTGASLDIAAAEDDFVSPFDRTVFLELYQGRCRALRTRMP